MEKDKIMSKYAMFQEIVNEIKARPEADPVGILEEYVAPLVDVCNQINLWIGQRPMFDFSNEPPWYERFIAEVSRFDIDLSPIWRDARAKADESDASVALTQPEQEQLL